jgi:hypothetical protein
MTEITVTKLTQSEGSNAQCDVMRKNHTRCTTHGAFHYEGSVHKNVCAFHHNIFLSTAERYNKRYVIQEERPIEEQVSPETRVS